MTTGAFILRGERTIHGSDATWADFCAVETFVPHNFNYALLSEQFLRDRAVGLARLEKFADKYGRGGLYGRREHAAGRSHVV